MDSSKHRLGRMLMCHMTATSEAELHTMAAAIGVARRHFQDGERPHYDICKAKRALAVARGAAEVSSKEIVVRARAMVRAGAAA